MTAILVAGALANKPGNGGEAWVRLSWLAGLRRLGFDVCFVEQLAPGVCVGPEGTPAPFRGSRNLAYFRRVVERFGLTASSSLIYDDGAQVFGMTEGELLARAEAAVALINISGHLTDEPLLRRCKRKVYIDLDPGFTQYWHADGRPLGLESHDHHFTVGENVGTTAFPIPTGGIRWRPIRQPVVLDDWPACHDGMPDRFSTVGTWRGPFGPVTHGERTFGLKVHEFRKFVELPLHAPGAFELALDIHPEDQDDRASLERHGWRLVNPGHVAGEPDAFRAYVQRSGAEFSVAQGIYVETASGWFSDRTVRYLASGKPALVQDTGFGRNLPTGEGLIAFTTMKEAVTGAEEIVTDYQRHSLAARRLAETYFDSDVVLTSLLETIGVTPPVLRR